MVLLRPIQLSKNTVKMRSSLTELE